MSIWKISWQNLKSKPLYTLLSIFALSLSIVLLLGVQQIKTSFKFQLENNLGDIDLVVGAKGSPLQLVLASVLHLDNPTGNISLAEAEKLSKNPIIKNAVPISYGDNYKGFRIVGTTNTFKQLYNAELQNGSEVNNVLEAVIGYTVAKETKLTIGDTFLSSHGLIEDGIETHDEQFKVVGILKPTQKIVDRLIITNLESIWDIHDHGDHDHEEGEHHNEHDHSNHEEGENHDEHKKDEQSNAHNHNLRIDNHDEHEEDGLHKEDKSITSLLITFRNPTGFLTVPRRINESTNMQAALPKYELDRLYNYLGVGLTTITWIAYLVLIISGLTIFISLYKMVKERAFDLALLRTYGATYFQVMQIVAYEGILIVVVAFLTSLGLTKFGLPLLLSTINVGFKGNLIQKLPFYEILQIGIIVAVVTFLSIVIAVYPIMKMKVSETLRDEK